jgi:hypothetical protein
MEEKSNEDIKHIQAWLQNVERLIRITKRERRQRPKNSSIMERFLGIQSQLPVQSHEHEKPQAYSQELNPD